MAPEQEKKATKLLVTSSPHLYAGDDISRIMWEVNLALVPALATAAWVFGGRAMLVVLASVLGACAGEAIVQKFFLKKPVTLCDGSAILTGLLLAFCCPSALPPILAFIGGVFATIFGKQIYGGLGQNIFNPAHAARAILLASWPVYMTTWLKPGTSIPLLGNGTALDGLTTATPLGFMKEAALNPETMASLKASGTTLLNHMFTGLHLTWSDFLFGSIGGSLGETGKIALLIGGLYLLIRGHITWHAPAPMMATVFLGALVVTGDPSTALFHLLSGGLIIGALFMVTDMVTSPVTLVGQIIFGVGCGVITLLIRMKGGYPEGVCYSILIMNAFVPLIDRFVVPEKFGAVHAPAIKEAKS